MQKLSNNKLVMLLVFFCAAIMSSVFIYCSNHRTGQMITLSHDAGTLLPVSREIKPFELVASDENPFTEKNLRKHWTLLFFGFTHCANVCPETLGMISRAYPELHQQYPNLQVVLISLDPERDAPAALKHYTANFHQDFIGVSGKLKEIRKLQSQLNIYSAKEAVDPGKDYQIQHTSSILLINPQGRWTGIYLYGLNPAQFTRAFKESMQILS